MRNNALIISFLTFIVGFAGVAQTEPLPQGISFVGLEETGWALYTNIVTGSRLAKVKTFSEPRTPTVNPVTKKAIYIGSDAGVYEISPNEGVTTIAILKAEKGRAYTQPAFDTQGNRMFVVSLKEGASVDTEILVWQNGKWKVLIEQRSAQFELYFHPPGTLYYSNVHCTEGCGKIIQEIWRKDLVSDIAEQVTLVNAIARQPVVSRDDEWLYFSSNRAGNYHIWRMSLKSREYQQLTEGVVTDESPALDKEGDLYFIRHAPDGSTKILSRSKRGALTELSLPVELEDIRDLEINP